MRPENCGCCEACARDDFANCTTSPRKRPSMAELTKAEREQIEEILDRRANEIAGFSDEYRRNPGHFGSVELALTREIERLRRLAERVNPADPEDDVDG